LAESPKANVRRDKILSRLHILMCHEIWKSAHHSFRAYAN